MLSFSPTRTKGRLFTKFKIVLLDVISPFFGKLSYWTKIRVSKKNRAYIGLTRKTEPDDSQPDPDHPDDFEPDPGARSPNAHPWFRLYGV